MSTAAKVTITLTPQEFDLLRAAVVQLGVLAKTEGDHRTSELSSEQRRERNQVAAQATDLARKLGA